MKPRGSVLCLAMAVGSGITASWTSAEQQPGAEAETMPRLVVVAGPPGEGVGPAVSAGLAIEITHALQTVRGLVVRSPVVGSPGETRPQAETARRYDAGYLLTLTVNRSDEHWSARYVLVEAEQEHAVASGEETVGHAELPELPGRVASAVIGELLPSGSSTVTASAEGDPDAYATFLKVLGEYAAASSSETYLRNRVAATASLFPELESYAPAVAALGDAYLELAGKVGGTGPYYERAGDALERAFELDPTYPPARSKLASYLAKLGRSEESAELAWEGLRLHPGFTEYHDRLGYVLRYAGHMDESMAAYRRFQALNRALKHLVSSQDQITKSYIYQGEYAQALESHETVLEHLRELGRPPDEKQHFYEGVIHLYAGASDRALAAFETGARVDPESVWTTFGSGYAAIARGDVNAVLEVLDRLEERDVVDGERHYRLVHFAAAAGMPDRAVEHLHQSVRSGFFNAPYIASDPLTSSLRSVPGFQDALAAAQRRHAAFPAEIGGGQPAPESGRQQRQVPPHEVRPQD